MENQSKSEPLVRFYNKVSQQTDEGFLFRYLQTRVYQRDLIQVPTQEKLFLPILIDGSYNYDIFLSYNATFLDIERLSDAEKQRLGFSSGSILDEKLIPRLAEDKKPRLISNLKRKLESDFDSYLNHHRDAEKIRQLSELIKGIKP